MIHIPVNAPESENGFRCRFDKSTFRHTSQMYQWCEEQFGSGNPARWYFNRLLFAPEFWFRDEIDQTLFMLRWA